MVEIEHIQDIEKDQPAKSSAKEQKLKDPVDANTETQDTEVSEATEHNEQIENQEDNTSENNILVNSNTNVRDLKPGDRFYGSIKYNNPIRNCIKTNSLRRIASTRMIQAAEKMKKVGMLDWKDMLIINWSDTEKNIVKQYIQKVEENKTKQSIASIIESIRNRFSNSTSTIELKTAA